MYIKLGLTIMCFALIGLCFMLDGRRIDTAKKLKLERIKADRISAENKALRKLYFAEIKGGVNNAI